MKLGNTAAVALIAVLVTACGQKPLKPAETHIRAEEARPDGSIPPPVQVSPVLPRPKPSVRPETYSVVVNNVRVQDLLFALARDARLNIDIHPDITGTVTLNAIDQTLPQLLARIARQVDMRYEIEGQNLLVMRDTPFLRPYRIDYASVARNVKMQSAANTQFGTSTAGTSGTGSTATIDVLSENKLWESIVQNVKEILRETDKIIPASPQAPVAVVPSAPPPGAPSPSGQVQPAPPPIQVVQPQSTFQEAASVIGNRESGVLYVRATSRQHEKVQEFLDLVMVRAKRQVFIEATVVEVQLSDEYQRGIDWQRLRTNASQAGRAGFGTGNSGFEFNLPSGNTSFTQGLGGQPFIAGYASRSLNFSVAIRLLESFGKVRVLSSPKLSVLNNQTALLRVTRDIIYFTITPSSQTAGAGGVGNIVNTEPTFTTTPNVAVEGFIMSVLPQVSEADSVVLNLRPTIRRRIRDVNDPNPALQVRNIVSPIPEFETREFESILNVPSGQIAVLGGLIQDSAESKEHTVPGLRDIPGLGLLFENRGEFSQKTELVIFLRPTVIRDASVDGDFRDLRPLLPDAGFFAKPHPQREPLP
jgi:MSHA biogenesis protein MshL